MGRKMSNITSITTTNIQLDPPYKQAVIDSLAVFDYGDLISHRWLYAHLGLPQPQAGSFAEIQKWHFDFLAAMESFREQLLEDHQRALQNERGKGWRIIQPKHQTAVAMTELKSDVSRSLRKAAKVLEHVKHELLTSAESQENAEAKAKLAAIRSFSRKAITG